MAQDGSRIEADPTVPEGGTIEFRVDGDVDHLRLIVPGVPPVRIKVTNGRAEYTLPPHVRGGSVIIVSDGKLPNPSGTSITVTGGSNR